jgi:hypothetical protein
MIKNYPCHVASFIGAFLFMALPSLYAVETHVLVIGSKKSYSNEEYSGIARNQEPFDPQLVVAQLQSILSGDAALGTVNVVFENTYRETTRNMFGYNYPVEGYSLLNYYYWPEVKTHLRQVKRNQFIINELN